MARYQTRSGRRLSSMGVPTVTRKSLPQSRQRWTPGRLATEDALSTEPQRSHTGPCGQRTLSRWVRQTSSVPNRERKVVSFMAQDVQHTEMRYVNRNLAK